MVAEVAKLIDRTCLILISALLLLLAGCASVGTQPPVQVTIPDAIPQDTVPKVEPSQVTIPQVEIPQAEIPQQPDVGIIAEPVPEPIISGNLAIIALLDRARLDTNAGQREAAGASLERALRIEPRNPWLWQELAQLRLTQGQYAQAISLARKSISFAGQDRRLHALNWRVIGNARVAQGNPSEAEQAFKLAAEFDQPAVPEQAAKPGQ